MAVSKATVLNALSTFKGLQDTANESKFVLQTAVEDGAQVNVIESITIDGTAQTINGKAVALDLSAYVKGTDVASALRYKSSVNAYGDLPSSGQKVGDVYNVKAAGGTDADGVAIKAGDNVVWNGSGWDVLAGTVDLSSYALQSEVQADLSGKVDKVTGKQLSTEDFTTALKEKLEAITDETITQADVQALFA